jgi:hypothetical protein
MFYNINHDKLFRILANTVVLVIFLVLTVIIYYYNSKDIELKIAWGGAGPQDYVAEKLHPENFRRNWPAAGVRNYDYSLPMEIYYYLAKYFGISPSQTIYPFMFFQTVFFLLSVAYLSQSLFQNRLVTIISVAIIPLSNLAGINLSRFGNGFGDYLSFPLFYGYSNAFRIFALGFFLKDKYILMFVFMALSIYCHINMGFFGLIFIGGYLIYKPHHFHNKNLQMGILIFVVLVAAHALSILSKSNAITSGGIPVDEWVKSTRLFSSHWYPITNKIFTTAGTEFFPFLLLCLFFFATVQLNEENIKIIAGCFACLVATIFGIIFSDIYPIPILIKISLQRSTSLITFIGVLFLINYLIKKIETNNVINILFSVYSLLTLVAISPGIAVFPIYFLLYRDIKEGHLGAFRIKNQKIRVAKYIYFSVAILILAITFICILHHAKPSNTSIKVADGLYGGLWGPLRYFDPFNSFNYLLNGGSYKILNNPIFLLLISSLITYMLCLFHKNRTKKMQILLASLLVLISVSIVFYHEQKRYLVWHRNTAKVASSYMDMQLWAEKGTTRNSLFMIDPSHHYGWRDFSHRSSFGNFREWGYTAITYNPNYAIYKEGIERIKEFGPDLNLITNDEVKSSKYTIYAKIFEDVQISYYNMNPISIRKLCKKYGIDYFVMFKERLKDSKKDSLSRQFKIAYENDYFIVFSVN